MHRDILRTHPYPVQVATLFDDLDDEVSSGSYINSLGQAQMSDSLRAPFPLDAPLPTASVGALSASSGAPATPTPNAVSLSQTLSSPGDTLHEPASAPQTQAAAAAEAVPMSGKVSGGGALPLATRSTSSSGTASGPGSHRSGGVPAAAAPAARLRTQPLVRPHRAAVRAVLSMPCDTIPEDQRAEFDPLPPFVSSGARASKGAAAVSLGSLEAAGSHGDFGTVAVSGGSVYDVIQKKRVAKLEGAAAMRGADDTAGAEAPARDAQRTGSAEGSDHHGDVKAAGGRGIGGAGEAVDGPGSSPVVRIVADCRGGGSASGAWTQPAGAAADSAGGAGGGGAGLPG